jgi:hypothetical protein
VPAADSRCCVVMDPGPVTHGTPLLTAGYPAKALVGYQAQSFSAGLPGRDDDRHPQLRIEGDVVTPGMSGSPVVSLQSGLVCGVVRLTKDSTSALGGFATMFSDFLDTWPELAALSDLPPDAAMPWVQILTPRQLKDAGRRLRTGARSGKAPQLPRLDLQVEKGAADTWGDWQISAQTTPNDQAVQAVRCTVADLGDGVMRAVDSWSRRQTFKLQDEVEVLGDVLRRAMLPEEAESALASALKTEGLLFRICLDKAPRLSHLPWELACDKDHVPFAASTTMTFSRFVDVAGRAPERKDTIRVLAVIECPESISKGLPGYSDENGKPIRPTAATFAATIRGSAVSKGERIDVKWAVNETQTELEKLFYDEEPWDVVHYIGFAFQGEKEQEFALVLGGERLVQNELAKLIEASGCSVFIAEFHKFAPGQDMAFPADLSGLVSLLRTANRAHPQVLIVTQSPMNVVELGRFNETFYERISGGRTVEEAVQHGRRAVKNQGYTGRDVAAFASFMVITTQAHDVLVLQSAEPGRPRPDSRAAARGEGAEQAPGLDADLGPQIGQVPETGAVLASAEILTSGELFTSSERPREADENTALQARNALRQAQAAAAPDAATRLQAPAGDRDEKVT